MNGPDLARKRRWPVEHVVYQRLELLKDENPNPVRKPL
jgi:hypothetical protein